MMKKLIAITLCLALSLLACACAASNATVSAPENTDSKGGNTPDLSTMEQPGTSLPVAQMSSRPAFSDAVSKPTEPTLPEERETTLELVQKISVGDSGIPIALLYEDDATYATLEYPFQYFANEKGEIFCYWYKSFYNLRTGETFKTSHSGDYFRSFAAYDDQIYTLTKDGFLQTYTIKDGLVSSVSVATENEIKNDALLFATDGTLTIQLQDSLYNAGGKKIANAPAFFSSAEKGEEGILNVYGSTYEYPTSPTLLDGRSDGLTFRMRQMKTFGMAKSYRQEVYRQHDSTGALCAQFEIICTSEQQYLPCSIIDSLGGECKWYYGRTVQIGKQCFSGVLFDTIFQGADNNLYLLLLYPDHADLYRIDPGYSDVTFTDLDSMKDPAEDNSAGSLRSTAATSDTEQHIYLSREAVARRVQSILETEWELTYDHLYDDHNHEEHVVLPGFIEDAVSGNDVTFPITLTGIPYCTGGMNGYETFGTDYTQRSFYENLLMTNRYGDSYRVGNIGKTYDRNGDGYHDMVPYTIGVDCSGFVGSTYGISTKKNVSGIANYGHIVADISDWQEYDFLVNEDESHCYFFKSFDEETNTITVVDCTGSPSLNNITEERSFSYVDHDRFTCYNPFFEYTITSTGHSCACTECSSIHAEEPHTFSVTYTASTHTSTCEECNHAITENHTMGYRYDTTYHWTYCTDGCGYEVPRKRAHTMQYGACSVCGYNTNNLQTRPGTEVILEQ